MKKKRIVYEYSYSEISEVLSLPLSTVKRIEKEALTKIAHYLSELDDFS